MGQEQKHEDHNLRQETGASQEKYRKVRFSSTHAVANIPHFIVKTGGPPSHTRAWLTQKVYKHIISEGA